MRDNNRDSWRVGRDKYNLPNEWGDMEANEDACGDSGGEDNKKLVFDLYSKKEQNAPISIHIHKMFNDVTSSIRYYMLESW